MDFVALTCLLLWIFTLALVPLGTALALQHFGWRRRPTKLRFTAYPPISVLKPLKGVDPGLRENLQSFFAIDYPVFELIFCVEDKEDPAAQLVSELCGLYPDIPARLLVQTNRFGLNPKVNNLALAYQEARYDWMLISDSNIRVESHYLESLAEHCDDDVGVVTAVVAGCDPHGLGANLEGVFLNTYYCRWMLLADFFNQPIVLGKSMLFRKSVAQRFGGIAVLARYIAEDYWTGLAMRFLGLRVVVHHEPVRQPIGDYSFKQFWARHLRWGRIRRSQAALIFTLELAMGSIPSAMIGAFAFARLAPQYLGVFFISHFAIWFFSDAVLIWRLTGELRPTVFFIWLGRELSGLPLWLHAVMGNTVLWRGRKLRVEPGGLLVP